MELIYQDKDIIVCVKLCRAVCKLGVADQKQQARKIFLFLICHDLVSFQCISSETITSLSSGTVIWLSFFLRAFVL